MSKIASSILIKLIVNFVYKETTKRCIVQEYSPQDLLSYRIQITICPTKHDHTLTAKALH